jgi:5-formyltetrahydrofolate cyclo-ligase
MARLRKSAIAARRSIDENTRNEASSIITERIMRSHEFNACNSIACYLSTYDEVDPSAIIDRAWRAKKRVSAPVTDNRGGMKFRHLTPDTQLERNIFGIWEPVSGPFIAAKSIDLVITPVVAFDNDRHRIGMGGAYFDRCFAFLKNRRFWYRPKMIGLAFDCQKVEKIVPNPWDIRLYKLFTEKN